jgi:NAD(P)-dependent dehydrogenase (short-subunit alcohol dehydrogenase family)
VLFRRASASRRRGGAVSISSTAGIVGRQFCSAYAAAKFGVEGWMESLAVEVEQFGIRTTIVEPGFFRTELLTPESTTWAELSIDDYAEQSARTKAAWQGMDGRQGGDPAKLATALVSLVGTDDPPARWVAGTDAVEAVESKAHTLLAQVDAHRELSSSLALDDA